MRILKYIFLLVLLAFVGITVYGTNLHLNVLDLEAVQGLVREKAANENIKIISMKPIIASLEDFFAAISKKKQ